MKTVLPAAIAGVVLSLAGCGGQKSGIVEGTVTIGGNPLEQHGIVTFIGSEEESQGTFNAGIIDGRYKSPPMPAGTYRVTVVVTGNLAIGGAGAGTPATNPEPVTDAAPTPMPAAGATMILVLDPKYASTETSGLEVTVQPGPNEWNLALDTVWK